MTPPAAYVVIDGPGFEGAVFALKEGITTIGRLPANDIVLSDGGVSRHHARISFFEDRALFQDLGSHNGSLVNGETVTTCPLQGGDRISVGAFQLSFRRGPIPNAAGRDEATWEPGHARGAGHPSSWPRWPWEVFLDALSEKASDAAVLDPGLEALMNGLAAERVALVRRRHTGRLTVLRNLSIGAASELVRPVVDWSVEHRKAVVLDAPHADPRFSDSAATGPVGAVPLLVHDQVWGVLYVEGGPDGLERHVANLQRCGRLLGFWLREWEAEQPPWNWGTPLADLRSFVLVVEISLPARGRGDTMVEGQDSAQDVAMWHGFLHDHLERVARAGGVVAGFEAGRVVTTFPFQAEAQLDGLCERLSAALDPGRCRGGLSSGEALLVPFRHQGVRQRFTYGSAVEGARTLASRAPWGELWTYRRKGASRLPWRPLPNEPAILRLPLAGLAKGPITEDVVRPRRPNR